MLLWAGTMMLRVFAWAVINQDWVPRATHARLRGLACATLPRAGGVALVGGGGGRARIASCNFQNNSLTVATSSACAAPLPDVPCDTFTDFFEAGSGGGLYAWSAPIELVDTQFEGNSAPRGGGLHVSGVGAALASSPQVAAFLSNVAFVGNRGGNGSALSVAAAAVTAVNVTVFNNAAENGAVYIDGSSALYMTGALARGNSAGRGAFAFSAAGSELAVASSVIADNTGNLGGAFYLEQPTGATVVRTAVSSNRAIAGGVAFIPGSQPAPPFVRDPAASRVTLDGNEAACWGSTQATADFSVKATAPPIRSGGSVAVTVTITDGYNQTVRWLPSSSVSVSSEFPVLGRPSINAYSANQSLVGVQLIGNESEAYRLSVTVVAPMLPAGGLTAQMDATVEQCSKTEVCHIHPCSWLCEV